MGREARRIGGWASLAAAGIAALWWWQASPFTTGREGAGLVVVGGSGTDQVPSDRSRDIVVAPQPVASSTPKAVDPVVAARRDVPVLAAVAGKGDSDTRVLDGAMTRQTRDAATAGPTEVAMKAALMAIPALAGGAEAPRILCVDTTCEVTGVAAPGRAPADVEQALRDPAMLRAMVARGYMPGPATVAATPGGGVSYLLYLNDEMGGRVTSARR